MADTIIGCSICGSSMPNGHKDFCAYAGTHEYARPPQWSLTHYTPPPPPEPSLSDRLRALHEKLALARTASECAGLAVLVEAADELDEERAAENYGYDDTWNERAWDE